MIESFVVIVLCIIGTCIGVKVVVNGVKDKVIFGLFIVGLVVVPIVYTVAAKNEKQETTVMTEEVTLTVSGKKYEPANNQIIPVGETSSVITYPESWKVTFTDGATNKTVDDYDLFNSLDVGDEVEGYRDTYKKMNGEINTFKLRLK